GRSRVASSGQIVPARELEGEWDRQQAGLEPEPLAIPPELRELLRQVVVAFARGKAVTVTTTPEEVTTTEAARELGISRPTLMKMSSCWRDTRAHGGDPSPAQARRRGRGSTPEDRRGAP